jgi:ElaB/YqjD/DUF883 family membrane-anchored ribosome-binding protein
MSNGPRLQLTQPELDRIERTLEESGESAARELKSQLVKARKDARKAYKNKRKKTHKKDVTAKPMQTCRVCGKTKHWVHFHGPHTTICIPCAKKERKKSEKAFTTASDQINKELSNFWNRFNIVGTVETKLSLLKIYSNKIFIPVASEQLKDARQQFLRNTNLRFSADTKCGVCGECYEDRHHIVQLSNGGPNIKKNLIPLCKCCHAEIHPWLKEIV